MPPPIGSMPEPPDPAAPLNLPPFQLPQGFNVGGVPAGAKKPTIDEMVAQKQAMMQAVLGQYQNDFANNPGNVGKLVEVMGGLLLPTVPLAKPSIGGSFQLINQPTYPRLVMALDGLEKEGKTHFALTAPDPIGYCAFDIGDEGVVDKFLGLGHNPIAKKVIHKAEYFVNIQKGMDQAAIMKEVIPVWDQFLTDWKAMMHALKKANLRTGILDTGSEAWEVLRLARFGKLTQIMPHHYTALNTEYRNLIREVFNTPGNLILLHKLKAQWLDNPSTGKANKTGNYERAGYSDTGFLVQVNALSWREKDPTTGAKTGPFHVTVRDCRQNATIAGQDFAGPMCHFGWVGMAVFPGTQPSDWGLTF